jgi:hypothetical protein
MKDEFVEEIWPVREKLAARFDYDLHERRKEYQVTGRFSTYLWRIALSLCYAQPAPTRGPTGFVREPEAREGAGEAPDCVAQSSRPDARVAQQQEGELVRQAPQDVA